jgi:hypothetical protein
LFPPAKAVERLYWVIKLKARRRSMMFGMAGLLFLNLGLIVQALAKYCYITVDPETPVSENRIGLPQQMSNIMIFFH